MNKRVIFACWAAAALLFSGCGSDQSRTPEAAGLEESAQPGEQQTDSRMSEASVTLRDAELASGDLGVERLLLPGLNSSGAGEERSGGVLHMQASPLLDPNGFPLIRTLPNPSIVPLKGSYVENVIQTAKSFLGTPYVFGSDRREPSSFDCSDFTRWAYLSAIGVDLPWDSRSQAAYVRAFSKRIYTKLDQAKRGDLLFFTRFRGNKASDYAGLREADKPVSHLGIYLGSGRIIHSASKETGGVRIDNIRGKHLEYRLVFGGGVLD